MDNKTRFWIKSMDFCSRYWGCHQMPERSFFIGKWQMPICARCTGIIIGYLISIIMCFFNVYIPIVPSILLIFPMGFDGLLQYFTKYNSNNIKRALTGIMSGIGFIQIILNTITYLIS